MNNFKLNDALYARKSEDILILGTAAKKTGMAGPARVGFSSARPASVKTPAKYSGAARFLDEMLVTKKISALEGSSYIYGEVIAASGVARFTVAENRISYEGERLHGFAKLYPVILYHLRQESPYAELKDVFTDIVKEYKASGVASESNVLRFCDTFYYAIAKNMTGECQVFETELIPETIQQSYNQGWLGEMGVLADLDTPALTGIVETHKKKKTEEPKKEGMDFESIKSGAAIINYEWAEEQKVKIPDLSTLENFVPSTTFYSSLTKIKKRMENVQLRLDAGMSAVEAIGKDFVNFFVVGKPGTGKTTMAYALGAATGMPTYTIAMTKNTEEDTFQGMTKVIDGSLSFASTDFLDAYTNGGIIILEEINLPDPSVIMGAIGQAVEFPFILMKDGYQPVRRHPMCVIIGTMNVGTYGSKGVNQALSSRFKQTYMLNDPNKEEFVRILQMQHPDKKACVWVYNAYDKITKFLKSPQINAEDIALNVTLRGCIGALENIAEGESPTDAITNTLIGKIAEADLELAEKVCAEIKSLPSM